MSQIYKVTLKPIGSFYFGGEQSFSSMPIKSIPREQKETIDYFKPRQGYFAKSEMFPQQTQLLGMLRKELLKANGLLLYFKNFTKVPKEYKDKAQKIVGMGKWSHEGSFNLGMIEELSPIFLEKEGSLYVSAPKDMGLKLVKGCVGYINGEPKSSYALQKCNGKYFGAKDYFSAAYIDRHGNTLDLDNVFTEQIRTHTQTLHYKEDDDEQLFKVKRYTLDDACSFVCYLTMSSGEHLEDGYTTTVDLGGEESHFVMQAQKVDALPSLEAIYASKKTNRCRIVLVSDAYVKEPKTLNEHIDVMFASKTILRTIGKKEDKKFHKTQKIVLLEKGSVLYPKEAQTATVKDMLESYDPFTTIGYNQFQVIQGEEDE